MLKFTDANENIRDFSGRKPCQYKINKIDTCIKDQRSEYTYEKNKRNGILLKRNSFLRKCYNKPNPNNFMLLSARSGSYKLSSHC